MSVWVIASLTFREASRRKILLAATLFGLLFLGIYALGLSQIQKEINLQSRSMPTLVVSELFNFILMAGLYVVNFLSVAMTVLTSVDTLSGEISSGTIQTLVSKPVRRWEILFGKWLGFVGMLSLYLLLMAGGVMLVASLTLGYTAPNALRGLGLMWLNLILLLGVSFLGGTFLSTLANGVLVFGLYGIAFIGGWIEQFGSFLENQTAVNIGILCSLILPAEALWKRAAYEMQSPIAGAMGNFSPFSAQSVPSPLMVGYAILYAMAALIFAIRQFNQRDL
ncbi:MAG: ABC transporter permease [Anaerolineales bacterium]|jgi:Cu-processing system permease protein